MQIATKTETSDDSLKFTHVAMFCARTFMFSAHMPFIQPYWFKIQLSTPALLDFIARTPPEYYYFAMPQQGKIIYGLFVSEDLVEFFTNEFNPSLFEITTKEVLIKARLQSGCKAWGNEGLLDL